MKTIAFSLVLGNFLLAGGCSMQNTPPLSSQQKSDEERGREIGRICAGDLKDRDKFEQVLELILGMEDAPRGGPDVLFGRWPNWYAYGIVYIDNYRIYGGFGVNKDYNLSFLQSWLDAKKHKKFEQFLLDKGYLNKDRKPNRLKVKAEDRKEILRFAVDLFEK